MKMRAVLFCPPRPLIGMTGDAEKPVGTIFKMVLRIPEPILMNDPSNLVAFVDLVKRWFNSNPLVDIEKEHVDLCMKLAEPPDLDALTHVCRELLALGCTQISVGIVEYTDGEDVLSEVIDLPILKD